MRRKVRHSWDSMSDEEDSKPATLPPSSPLSGDVHDCDSSSQGQHRSQESQELCASNFVRARRASRSRLRSIRSGHHDDEEDDDGSVPTFCPHCQKEYRQNNR